ncbi:PTS sugar transporter subunit IIA, partial [Vibrio vulnificus]|nr:PTS sugar transporter subunit IIA [Vibrio vulnificus]
MITKLTNVNLIKGNLQANNKNEVFAELAKMLFENNRISSKEAFLTDIEAREALSITSMDGIAYPHAKSKAVIEPAIAVGVKREGIEYGNEE